MDTPVQTFDSTPGPPHRPAPESPRLRTLLLTDLVDSVGLVERLGDAPASDLFRAHDRLVLQLQQRWHGRLIDRSDGMLLLFERPIDGLGFALDYTRGLIALGEARGIRLRARAGLHVGEVLTWRNSDDAVSVGAKPVEVEGLAKPMAARLMATARPGQILLSAVAEPLAHRAARELGERGQHLAWKSWGRWRFKGVPESQYIFEVGEPGIAPLRMPPDTPKAWRDIPLWRRPAALAAEAALLIGLASGAWFITRPEPAIAFNQRDWVVIGDLRNLTGQATLDDSLQQAFRISLEQSRYVNVLSDLKARDTLARMQRPPATKLDRAIASEIALRDGARAVILPTVAEVGGRVRVSAEVIDPRTQTTVYTETAEGKGVDSTLDSIDTVTASLRGKLGEAVKSIEKDSVPLPQVTTRNLDALRAYALGQKAYGTGDFVEALALYRRATSFDSRFALAWVGQARSLYSLERVAEAVDPMQKALALKARLAPREAMYLEGWASELSAPGEALDRWQELAKLYPDFLPAQGNAALALYARNRFEEARPFAKRQTAPQYDLVTRGYDVLGRIELASENYPAAERAFAQAVSRGYEASRRRQLGVAAAQRDLAAIKRLSARLAPDSPFNQIEHVSLAIDQARWLEGQSAAEKALSLVAQDQPFAKRAFLFISAVPLWLGGKPSIALARTRSVAAESLKAAAAGMDRGGLNDAGLALTAGLFAQRLGDRGLARQVIRELAANPEVRAFPVTAEMIAILRAEEARLSGRPDEALQLLLPLVTGHERFQTRVALMEAYAAAGQFESAVEQARWLQRRRGLAYSELNFGQTLQALNVADSHIAILREAQFLERMGRAAEARPLLIRFDREWPAESLPDQLRLLRFSRVDASKLGLM